MPGAVDVVEMHQESALTTVPANARKFIRQRQKRRMLVRRCFHVAQVTRQPGRMPHVGSLQTRSRSCHRQRHTICAGDQGSLDPPTPARPVRYLTSSRFTDAASTGDLHNQTLSTVADSEAHPPPLTFPCLLRRDALQETPDWHAR